MPVFVRWRSERVDEPTQNALEVPRFEVSTERRAFGEVEPIPKLFEVGFK